MSQHDNTAPDSQGPVDRQVMPPLDGRAMASMLAFEKRRCYVCGARADEGCCGGVDGERAECPWY